MLAVLGKFLNNKSQRISSAALTVAVFGLISRLFGLWRDRILAGKFGAGESLDIYYAAFKIPDLLYNLLIVGAVSSAFLPVFYEYLTEDKEKAWHLAGKILNILLISLAVLSLVLIIFSPILINLVAPGFSQPAKNLTAALSRLMFLSTIFLGISAFFSALLQAFSRFLITSLAPIFYNLGIIFGAVFLTPIFGLFGLAYGVVLGAVLHFLIQIPAFAQLGFKWRRPIFDFKDSGVKKVVKLWAPRTLSLFALQANSIVTTAIASALASGSIAVFNLADNLRSVPVGIVGVAFSTAAFPAMSLAYAQGKKDLFLRRFSLAVRQTLFMVMPLTFFFFILRAQIVRIILGTGEFGWEDTRLTAAALGLFAFGIFAAALLPLFTRAFFVFHNAKTPVFINVVSMVLNILLSFLFVGLLVKSPFLSRILVNFLKVNDMEGVAVLGLPLALTIASVVNLSWHWLGLKKYVGDFGISGIKKSFLKIFAASAVGVIFAYAGLYAFAGIFGTHTSLRLLLQTSGAFLTGAVGYLAAAFFFGCEEILMLGAKSALWSWRGVKEPEPAPTGETLDDQY